MTEGFRATVRTTPTDLEMALALLRSVEGVGREGFAILWAQFCGETGRGRHCYNFNIGNVKHVSGDGFDFMTLRGVWEGMSLEKYAELKAGSYGAMVRLDDDPGHLKAVAPRVSVLFDPPHPTTQFRAYDSLEHAVAEHALFLSKRYPLAWEAVLVGDVKMFAHQLKARGYFTANESAYVASLEPFYREAMASSAFEHAIALRKDEIGEEPTNPVVYALPELFPVTVDLNDEDTGDG